MGLKRTDEFRQDALLPCWQARTSSHNDSLGFGLLAMKQRTGIDTAGDDVLRF